MIPTYSIAALNPFQLGEVPRSSNKVERRGINNP
jgi:hypothetical protein